MVHAYNPFFWFDVNSQDFILLDKGIKKLFTNRKYHLSGVALFRKDFNDSIFIPNEQAGQLSGLNKDEIEKLGMRYMD